MRRSALIARGCLNITQRAMLGSDLAHIQKREYHLRSSQGVSRLKRCVRIPGLGRNAGDLVTYVIGQQVGDIPPPSHGLGSALDPSCMLDAMHRYTGAPLVMSGSCQ